MKILVTGAYGQLGGELCRQLKSDAIPRDVDTLDLTRGPTVTREILELRPEAVINCAAYTQVDLAESEVGKCRAVNVQAVEHLAAVCRAIDCPLVQISTDYVFGGRQVRGKAYREDERPSPQGVYAQSKYDGESAAGGHAKHLIVRTCGLYARPSDEKAKNFLKTVLRFGRSRPELKIVADQHCTPSYVPHVARAVLALLGVTRPEPAPWGIYHVTNRGQTTWYEFAVEAFRLAGMETSLAPISTAEYGAAAPRPAYSVLDTTAYHRLGGPAMPDWKQALREYFDELTAIDN